MDYTPATGLTFWELHHPVSHLSTNRYVAVSNWPRLYSYSLYNSLYYIRWYLVLSRATYCNTQ